MRSVYARCVVILALIASTGLAAEQLAPVGQGAPRSTLAYLIAKPEALLQIAGHDGEDFVWAAEVRRDGPPVLGKLIDTFRDLLLKAERIDIALVDVTLSGPKLYADITLGAGQKFDLKPNWIPEGMLRIGEVELNSIKVTRYSKGDGEAEMDNVYAFIRAGHLYICLMESMAEQLTSAIAKGPVEGESLAEFGRFSRWYQTRKPVSLEVWFNTRELNDWMYRVLQGDALKKYKLADNYLEVRNWDRFTIAFDLDQKKKLASLAIDIASLRDIPGLAKLGLSSTSFKLAQYVPKTAGVTAGLHLGDLNDLWKKIADEIRKQTSAEPDGSNSVDAKVADFNRGMQALGVPLTFDAALGIFDGDAIGGVCVPAKGEALGVPGKQMPIYMAIGLAERQLLLDTIEKARANTLIPVGAMLTRAELRGNPVYAFAGKGKLLLASDAALLVLVESAESCDRVLGEMLDASATGTSSPLLQEVLRKQSTFTLGVDALSWLDWKLDEQTSESRILSAYAKPLWFNPADVRKLLSDGVAASLTFGVTAKSFHFDLEVRGANVADTIKAGKLASTRDARFYYAESQVEALAQAIRTHANSSGKSPTSFDQLLESKAIRLAHIQSPFDPRFEGSAKLSWFSSYRLEDDSMKEDPEVLVVLAAEKKGFQSYTLVKTLPETLPEGWNIVAFETDANTAGGRMVAYANGRSGWLHAEVWPDALKLIAANEPIPAVRKGDNFDTPPDEESFGKDPLPEPSGEVVPSEQPVEDENAEADSDPSETPDEPSDSDEADEPAEQDAPQAE